MSDIDIEEGRLAAKLRVIAVVAQEPIVTTVLDAAHAIEKLEKEVQSSWRMHANACERHINLGVRIMRAIAEGRPWVEVLDIVGDDLNEVDAVDDESIALFEAARARLSVANREQDPS